MTASDESDVSNVYMKRREGAVVEQPGKNKTCEKSEVDKGNERPAVPAADVGVGPLPRKPMLSATMEKSCGTLFEFNLTTY
jgi:hypothetical protein